MGQIGQCKALPTLHCKRLAICHADATDRRIKALPLVFESKKTGNYHEDMNAEVLESQFFDQRLPVIPQRSKIVIDNASYHSRINDYRPLTSSSTKGEMISGILARGVYFPRDLHKPELYELIRLHKPQMQTYVIDKKHLRWVSR